MYANLSSLEFMLCFDSVILLRNDSFEFIVFRVGIAYYDSSIRQLHVLEAWEDGTSDFPLISLGMYSPLDVEVPLFTQVLES